MNPAGSCLGASRARVGATWPSGAARVLKPTLVQNRPSRRSSVTTRADAGNPDEAPKAVSLVRQYTGVEYTFVLAGFLKIITMASLVQSAPEAAVRTTLGKASQWLLVPVGLLMCWIAKQITDAGLQYEKKFMRILIGVLVFLYFFIYKLLYKIDTTYPERISPSPVSNMSGPMATARQRAGDRDISGRVYKGSSRGVYQASGRKNGGFDDLAYYEGQYPSQIKEETMKEAKVVTDRVDLDKRNPLRVQARAQSAQRGRMD